jgi:5-deoxy-glucuronate isomerase
MDLPAIDAHTCIVRNTAAKKGRTRAVSPATTAARYLHYGRIILGASDPAERVDPGDHETGLVCLKGSATVTIAPSAHQRGTAGLQTGGSTYTLVPYDALYVPRDTAFDVVPGAAGCDLAELSAPVAGRYPVQFVAFDDVKRDPGLHFRTGGPACERDVNLLLAKNVEAGRILAGVTFSAPGNWTSWPPHEHAALLEEAYLYIDMPAPAFGVQLVYANAGEPELATIVREGDVVLMPQGYHPNVAAPGGRIGFLWMMAANREVEDRQFGVVNVQPDFAAIGSGLDRGRTGR